MIRNLSDGGKRQLIAHLHNLRVAVFFIKNHADCIELDDEQVVDLNRADKIAEVIESFTWVQTTESYDE